MSALRSNAANAAKCAKTLKQRETLLNLRFGLAVGTMSCHFKLNLMDRQNLDTQIWFCEMIPNKLYLNENFPL